MTTTELTCIEDERRDAIRSANVAGGNWNGIDYVEVEKLVRPRASEFATIDFLVHINLFCPLAVNGHDSIDSQIDVCDANCIAIDRSLWEIVGANDNRITLGVRNSVSEQLGHVVLRVVIAQGVDASSIGKTDQRFASAEIQVPRRLPFDQNREVDPKAREREDGSARENPVIDYTARDYQSFLQLIRDRLALSMPEWNEQHIPDVGVAITEVMAFVADHLAYFQDAVATEAYLSTARNRISVRRHARLIDYEMDEGSNARTMLQVQVARDIDLEPSNVYFVTRPSEQPEFDEVNLLPEQIEKIPKARYQIFEPFFEKPNCQATLTIPEIRDPIALLIKTRLIPADQHLREIYSHLREQLAGIAARVLDIGDKAGSVLDRAPQFPPLLANPLVQALNAIIRSQEFYRMIDSSKLSRQVQDSLACCNAKREWNKVNRIILDDLFPCELTPKEADSPRIKLFRDHNEIEIYTWDQQEYCLPIGATHLTLRDRWIDPRSQVGCVDPTTFATNDDENVSSPSDLLPGQDVNFTPDPPRALKLGCGDLLLLEETIDPNTGSQFDANQKHRQIVRITKVKPSIDRLHDVPVLEVYWDPKDSLQFPLCVSAVSDAPNCHLNTVAVARGNIVPVDHGETIHDEELPIVKPAKVAVDCEEDHIADPKPIDIERYRPVLGNSGLVFSTTARLTDSASSWLTPSNSKGLPAVHLLGIPTNPKTKKPIFSPVELRRADRCAACIAHLDPRSSMRLQNSVSPSVGQLLVRLQMMAHRGRSETVRKFGELLCRNLLHDLAWQPQQDLLSSSATDRHFVVEMDNEGNANLRFGNGLGKQPDPGLQYFATYRIGGGDVGNVGAGAITRVVHRSGLNSAIIGVTNPLPAAGGRPAESIDNARISAPRATRQIERAIVVDDYLHIVHRDFADEVNGARCTMHRCGAIRIVVLTVDPKAGVDLEKLKNEIRRHLTSMRRAAHVLLVEDPKYVPIEISLKIRTKPGQSRSQIRIDLARRLGGGQLPDGSVGFFHPDRYTFGHAIHPSQLIAEAMKVQGVFSAEVANLKRLHSRDVNMCDPLVFRMREIPVIDNPQQELGQLRLAFEDCEG